MTYYRLEQIRGIDRCLEKVLAVRREGRGDRQPGHRSAAAGAARDEGQSRQRPPRPIHGLPRMWAPLAKGGERDLLLPTDTGHCEPGPAARQKAVRGHVTSIVTAPVTRALEFHSNFYQHRYSWRAPLLGMK